MTNGEKIQTILDIDRDCTDVHGENGTMTFSVSQNWWNAEYKEPSSSGKPNKSIEEKCPCYYCEHFEIKGWSHCKIHEGAYGDSRCNDYHKVNQKPNKSEIPTGSTADAPENNVGSIEPTTKNDLVVDCIDRQAAITFVCKNIKEILKDTMPLEVKLSDDYLYENVAKIMRNPKVLPPVTPQEPRIITCKDCKYYRNKGNKRSYCTKRLNVDSVTDRYREPNFYCADAVLREVEE